MLLILARPSNHDYWVGAALGRLMIRLNLYGVEKDRFAILIHRVRRRCHDHLLMLIRGVPQ